MIEFSESSIPTTRGLRHALVMTPRQHVVVGRERLAALRQRPSQGAIDRQCVAEVTRRRGRIEVLVFRGASDEGDGSWRFADDLAPDDADELGRLMVASMAPTRLALMQAGVFVHVHSDFSPRDADLFKRGTARVIDDAQLLVDAAGDAAARARAQADLWSLKHLSFYLTSPLGRVLDEILVDKLPLLEHRSETLRQLLEP